jgi:hypothetical protein
MELRGILKGQAAVSSQKRQTRPVCLVWLVVALVCMLLMPQAYGAPDFYVTDNGAGSGASWGDPSSLANALSGATASDVIWMKAGNYTDASTFLIATDGLQIYGGFAGTETLLSERDWASNPVLLNGQNTRRVVDIQADDVLLDGLTITNGYQNTGNGSGLRMENSGTNLTMLNCRIDGNLHSKDQGFGGGAYFSNAGNVLLSNTVCRANRATIRGNGVGFASAGTTTLTVLDCEVRGNYDSGADQRPGKGFHLASGTLTMVRTTVADNWLTSHSDWDACGGGGYIASGSTASFTNCVFTGNSIPDADGAGLYIRGGTVTIENCTFAGNAGSTGNANSQGGALYVYAGTVTIKNSIFWGNEAGTDSSAGDAIYQDGGTLNISYCCIDGTGLPRVRFVNGTWGAGIVTNNPLFATDYTDVHLKSTLGRWNGSSWVTDAVNSPCIDAGDPASAYGNEPSGAHGARINMGAYGNTWQASKSTNEAPTVETRSVDTNATAALLRGSITNGSSSSVRFYYGLSDGMDTHSAWAATNILSLPQTPGVIFSAVAGGLQANQTYYFRVYATNDFGYDWSEVATFDTGDAAPGGGAGVIHVDADAVGVEEGLSWTNAFRTFEDALTAAEAGLGTKIWVAAGTYQPQNTFVIRTNGLSVYGGFAGTETTLSQRNWTNNQCLLSGGGLVRVVDIRANGVLLDGLVITNGCIDSGVEQNGAGLRMENSGTGLTMLNCRVVDNYLADDLQYGGGIYLNNAGVVLISNCVVNANRGYRTYGNGFYSGSTTLTIIDSEIVGNEDVRSGQQRQGKGFYLNGGSLTMVGTTVADNYAPSGTDTCQGGGGYMTGSTVSFTNCIFSGNLSQQSDGGGLYINSGNITIENCTFAGNGGWTDSPDPEGGAIFINNATVTIKNSIFWGNETGNDANDGDTIYKANGTLTISYSCLGGTAAPQLVSVAGTLNLGSGIITTDPLFAVEYTDVHLKSRGGRWNGSSWISDGVHSPCIDAGDPASDYSREPNWNWERINMGAYGNTAEASLSWQAGGSIFFFQ